MIKEPVLDNIPILLEKGANIKVYNPIGDKLYQDEIKYCESIEKTLKDVDLCIIFMEGKKLKILI